MHARSESRVDTNLARSQCPLWVRSRHRKGSAECLLHPQKRTLELTRMMSALCQKRTFCAAAERSLFDHLVGAGEQRRRHSHAKRLCTSALCHKRTSELIVPGGYARGRGVSFVNCGSIDSSNKISDLRSRVPHTLTSGTFGTMPRRGGPLSPPLGGFRLGGERRLALARRGSGSFSGRGLTGPSG